MPVDVCGTSVPDVWDVLDVVPAEELVEVVDCAVVVVTDEVEVVDEEVEEDGVLEQAVSARTHAGRIKRWID